MNSTLVAASAYIAAVGVINSWNNGKPITKNLIGAFLFLFLLALLDMAGGDVSKIATALAMLAVLYVTLTEVPWSTILGAIGAKTK